jgi:phosphodiesterase/alkaline phosphatase D-like protein
MTAVGGDALVLGPLLRYVDSRSAAVWVEVVGPAEVTVGAFGRTWTARTFGVHGHHYALVECDGLPPGETSTYTVSVDGRPQNLRWGALDLSEPVISTLAPDRPPRLVFGSCRTSVPHDEAGNRAHGVDALRSLALALGGVTGNEEGVERPDLMLFLGDQVYADETSEEMKEFIASRRDLDEPPGTELKDFEEYAHLYALAWGDPANRWLLATVPSAMIFDDHDVRDDWNTSARWREEMAATDWWHGRIVAALASYWVYQHLGNLSPDERAADEVYRLVAAHDGPDELDLTDVLDRFAERVDREPSAYRWSYARDIGGSRVIVVDSRAARVLDEDRRTMLDERESAWLDGQLRGGVDHLVVATSLPFLLPEGLHHLEAFSEALASGGWGRRGKRLGEWLRQTGDLEHWAAFQRGFQELAASVMEVADGRRGRPPASVLFLSGDVHHSYVSRVAVPQGASTIVQAVCSPMRNPLPRAARWGTALLSYGIAAPMGLVAARSARVPDPPFRWRRVRGPWFDNNVATLDLTGDGVRMRWLRGEVRDDRHELPELREVAAVRV